MGHFYLRIAMFKKSWILLTSIEDPKYKLQLIIQ